MSYFREKFDSTGYREDFIAKKLDIDRRTLQRWLKLEKVDQAMKVLELLNICDVHMCDILNIYHKTDKFECKYCKNKKDT